MLARGQSIKDFQKSIMILGRRLMQITQINILKINITCVYLPAIPARHPAGGWQAGLCEPARRPCPTSGRRVASGSASHL